MKKVMHIISSQQWRGGEQQVNHLFNYISFSFDKYLFCPEGAELIKRNLHKQERIFSYKKRFGLDISAGWKLKNICSENSIALIHLHDSHAISTYLLAGFFGMNIPAVVHRHVNFEVSSKWKYRSHKIQKVICVSEEVKKTMMKAVDENKLTIIPPAIEIKKFSEIKDKRYLHNELVIPAEKITIGTVTSLEKEKNVGEFISIAKEILQKRNDILFVVAGDGSEREKIRQLNSEFNNNIVLLGFRNDVPQILPGLDIFLFTSSNEGFALVLPEAMAAKVPIVTTNAGGIKNVIIDGVNGLFYEAGNIDSAVSKIEALLKDEALRISITENASRYVEQFGVTLMNEKIEAVYSSLII